MCNLLTNYFIKDSFYIQDMCFFQFKMIVSNVVSITITVEFESRKWRGVLDTKLCDKVCQRLAAGLWFSPGTPVSSTNKTEILLKVALNTINHQCKHFIIL